MNLDSYKKNLLIKSSKFRYIHDLNNIIKISEIEKINKILINIEIYNNIRLNEKNLKKFNRRRKIDKDILLLDSKIKDKQEILDDPQN